jgi:hypothetical protein
VAPAAEDVSAVTRPSDEPRIGVNAPATWADTQYMMISKEQARAAAAQLTNHSALVASAGETPVSPEVFNQAFVAALNAPATDVRRVADARTFLARDAHSSRDVAEMMIQRIVSDALR